MSNFRCPNTFWGGGTEIVRKLDVMYGQTKILPVKFLLTVNCYANVTFKGRDFV